MSKNHAGTAIPRHFVYVTVDGLFVARLAEHRLQDLLSGQFRELDDTGFGHPIADYELNQLKLAGIVEDFNRQFVWLLSLAEPHLVNPDLHTIEAIADRQRVYYLNTTLPKSQADKVRALLVGIGLGDDLTVDVRGEQVMVFSRRGRPFKQLREAEEWQKKIRARVPNMFSQTVIAFTEVDVSLSPINRDTKPLDGRNIGLDLIIASQSDTTLTAHKQAVLLLNQAEEREAISELCSEMKMVVWPADTGRGAMEFLEDGHADLLVMDLKPTDMHAWAILGKVKEIDGLRNLPIIVIADHGTPDQQSMALVVAQVDVYLVRPLSKARLRQNIWMVMNNRQ